MGGYPKYHSSFSEVPLPCVTTRNKMTSCPKVRCIMEQSDMWQLQVFDIKGTTLPVLSSVVVANLFVSDVETLLGETIH